MKIIANRKSIEVDLNISPIVGPESQGVAAKKDIVVLHETVSPDYVGFADIIQTAGYLAAHGLGIHAVIDLEGYLGWALNRRHDIFYHTDSSGNIGNGHINTRAIGIELVSRVMLDEKTQALRWKAWLGRQKEINKLGQLLAFISSADDIPLTYSNGKVPGITTHWQVTKTFGVQGGHVDCWPFDKGGYFPMGVILKRAQFYQSLGY